MYVGGVLSCYIYGWIPETGLAARLVRDKVRKAAVSRFSADPSKQGTWLHPETYFTSQERTRDRKGGVLLGNGSICGVL